MKKAKLLIAALMLLASAAIAGAQNINVSGTVVDSHSGEAITGAAVQLKGSSTKYSMTHLITFYYQRLVKNKFGN